MPYAQCTAAAQLRRLDPALRFPSAVAAGWHADPRTAELDRLPGLSTGLAAFVFTPRQASTQAIKHV